VKDPAGLVPAEMGFLRYHRGARFFALPAGLAPAEKGFVHYDAAARKDTPTPRQARQGQEVRGWLRSAKALFPPGQARRGSATTLPDDLCRYQWSLTPPP
jgi:hypothetical protein